MPNDGGHFPMFFEEVGLIEYRGFFFMMPESVVGRDDIQVNVDIYGPGNGKYLIQAWVMSESDATRYLAYDSELPQELVEQGDEHVAYVLNESAEFMGSVSKLLRRI